MTLVIRLNAKFTISSPKCDRDRKQGKVHQATARRVRLFPKPSARRSHRGHIGRSTTTDCQDMLREQIVVIPANRRRRQQVEISAECHFDRRVAALRPDATQLARASEADAEKSAKCDGNPPRSLGAHEQRSRALRSSRPMHRADLPGARRSTHRCKLSWPFQTKRGRLAASNATTVGATQ